MGLLYSPELADRAQAWMSRPLTAGPEGKRSSQGLLELASIWAAINRLPLPECLRQCQYSERCASVAAYLRDFSRLQNPETMSENTTSKYQLAPAFVNETLVDENLNGSYNAANLTDEVAEHFIKKGRKDLFVERSAKTDTPAAEGAAPTDARDYAGELEHEQKAHAVAIGKLEKEQEAHTKASEALKSEKEAHKATKKELTETSKQLTEANKQVAELSAKLTEATTTAADSTADAAN